MTVNFPSLQVDEKKALEAGIQVPHIVLVFEDVLSFEDLKNNPALAKMVFNGRHFFMCIILMVQDVKGILPSHRSGSPQ